MESTFGKIRAQTAWFLFYGPALSFLPERWRGRNFNQKFASWGIATTISGVFELALAINLFCMWYVFQLSPVLAWIGIYFICDGGWRAFNSFINSESAGSVLLLFLDQAVYSARQGIWKVAHPVVADLTKLDDAREDWQLKIEAARAKPKWEVGKLMLYGERYFRIESCMQMKGPRPFVYLLRSLPAGVPSHAVLKYTPVEISQKRN
ncbi:MAG: hypothetical protein WAM91_06130 [Candidatus Acidiferrales bacterium]